MAEKINKYEAIAPQILELVGGKDNIRSFAHCMTRLRFNVKDKGLVDADKIGKLPGCMGTQWAGDQLQVIIGQAVDKAYDARQKNRNEGALARLLQKRDFGKGKTWGC